MIVKIMIHLVLLIIMELHVLQCNQIVLDIQLELLIATFQLLDIV